MAGKGGGAWKVAYADFVTAMMAFFLVMWIVAQNKPVKEAVAGYFRDPYGTGSKPSGAGILPGKAAPAPSMKSSIKVASRSAGSVRNKDKASTEPTGEPLSNPAEIEGRKRGLMVLHDGDNAAVGATVSFAEDSAELDDSGMEHLRRLAAKLVGKPNKIEVRGHATGRPLPEDSPFQDAWQLSYARCLVAMQYLQEHGVEPDRFRLSQAGSSEPQSLVAGQSANIQNSRVEVYMLSEYTNSFKGTRKERNERFRDSKPPLPQASRPGSRGPSTDDHGHLE